ncbi:hypothetical protein QMK61_03590 [Fulvimonas sp. R45]|uniref:hypothetical protein n=1 Tax=Fulvimonas sp. R45 TaxID=3045937 RepID=UPI00265ED789|nr:hypothetical protein [Fulvimonas sp. R45]MDO1527906.1 hypothetical protein [Fulvimonas sp. R45]
MTRPIKIPGSLGDKDLEGFFRGWNWYDDPESPVVFNVERGTHIAPWAAGLFGAYALWLKEVRGKEVQLEYDKGSYVGRFLTKVGFTKLFGIEDEVAAVDSQRIFPLTRITESKQIPTIANAIIAMLEIGDEEVEDALKYSLVELLRNVVQHANSRIGGLVCAVYFPKSGLVDVVVIDIGRGVRAALRDSYPEINSDQKAVRFAMQPHVSGTFHEGMYQSMKDNAGLGLFFIREIASRAYGGFFLGSGSMLADVWGEQDGTQKKKYIQSSTLGWRGTFALLQLRKNAIGEFGALLSLCRDIAAQVRKDRSELAVDFVDEKMDLDGLLTVNVKSFEEDVEAAALVRDQQILPALERGDLVVLDFSQVRAATQSFIHALMYRLFRDGRNLEYCLSVSCADGATEEAIRAVSAYASVEKGGMKNQDPS